MDDKKLEDLKKETEMDNSRLEELIKQDITPEMQSEVFKLLKESRLFMPIVFDMDALKGIEDAKPGDEIEGPQGFSIQFLKDQNGNRAVPLFTSEKMMENAGSITGVMAIYMSDLADLLKQSDDYSVIAINPFTEYDLNMTIEAFLAQFREEPEIADIRNDRLRQLIKQENLSEEEFDEFTMALLSSVMIAGCVDAYDGTNFVLIWNDENKPHLPLFTDLDEFKKIFSNYKEDVYPQAYHFRDLTKVAKENLVINPASESFVLDPEIFKM